MLLSSVSQPSCFHVGCIITLYVILSMFSSLVSGIPSNPGPFPSTTNNLHLPLLSLCLNFTICVPNNSLSD